MGWLLSTLLFLSPAASANEPLPSHELLLPLVVVQNIEPVSFDLLDMYEDARDEKRNIKNEDPHTIFIVKRHVGASVGYDNAVLHGSVGLYLTVAEWGRWNFGVPSLGVGLGRYPIYDRSQRQSSRQNQATVFVSVASVHYRVGYLQSLGVNWYVNLEQVYDLRYNMSGSQFGISFSTK
jgi:hypothetical protein